MAVRARVVNAVRRPRTVVYRRLPLSRLVARHARLARRRGLHELYLVLSFDCDTVDDAAVVARVHERLQTLGVTASYAVPGELLERGADEYRAVAQAGGEFINHGYAEHTVVVDGVYRSTLFYDALTTSELRDDVVGGDRAVRDVVGVRPRGFRVPHFGTFQAAGRLRSLHRLLASLGYAYSSSTTPIWGFRRGPAYWSSGIVEFPVSGTATRPLEILDSWSFFSAPDTPYSARDYLGEAGALAAEFAAAGAGVLSLYADPSQVCDHEEFFAAVAAWADVASPTTYGELVNRVRR